jgi:hypothetical protein
VDFSRGSYRDLKRKSPNFFWAAWRSLNLPNVVELEGDAEHSRACCLGKRVARWEHSSVDSPRLDVSLNVSVHGPRVTCVQDRAEVRAEAGSRASP